LRSTYKSREALLNQTAAAAAWEALINQEAAAAASEVILHQSLEVLIKKSEVITQSMMDEGLKLKAISDDISITIVEKEKVEIALENAQIEVLNLKQARETKHLNIDVKSAGQPEF